MTQKHSFTHLRSAKNAKAYHYVESGLDNIWLVNGVEHEQYDGETYTRVMDVDALHRAIAEMLTKQTTPLRGVEVRFLRKEMDLTQAELGKLMGVTSQTVARWEKDETEVPQTADLLIRAFMLCELNGQVNVCDLAESLSDADDTSASEKIAMTHVKGDWSVKRVPQAA